MTWVKLDDSAVDHPKIAALSHRTFRTWIRLLSYANKHTEDGVVGENGIKFATNFANRSTRSLQINDLVSSKLLIAIDAETFTFKIHDWDIYQAPAVKEAKRKRLDRERKQRQRTRDAEELSRGCHADSHADSHAEKKRDTCAPVPVPVPVKEAKASSREAEEPAPKVQPFEIWNRFEEVCLELLNGEGLGSHGGEVTSKICRRMIEHLQKWHPGDIVAQRERYDSEVRAFCRKVKSGEAKPSGPAFPYFSGQGFGAWAKTLGARPTSNFKHPSLDPITNELVR